MTRQPFPDLSQQPQNEESFFDPSTLAPELMPAYKQMQAAMTKKSQEWAETRKAWEAKVQAYDQFAANPQAAIQQLAGQYGLTLQQAQEVAEATGDWEPQDWQEVTERITQQAREAVLQELQPVLGKVRDLQKSNIESQLDAAHPDWRVYEKEMIGLMQEHPTLANNPDMLYEMAVPPEVKARRAVQAAKKKLEESADSASVSSPSSTNKKPSALPPVTDFNSAVAYAREKLATGG